MVERPWVFASDGAPDAATAERLAALDTGSRDALAEAVRRPPVRGLELTTLDGRVLDAVVAADGGRVRADVRDVTRYARATEQLGSMAVALARRNRDLRTVYAAVTELDTTLELGRIAAVSARIVGEYLDAAQVEIVLLDEAHVWTPDRAAGSGADGVEDPEAHADPADPRADIVGTPTATAADAQPAIALRTARGEVGTLRWWRADPLSENEAETLPLLCSRAAIGLDHALLLSSARRRADRDELTGLLNRGGARRGLARLVAPCAVALLDLDRFKEVNDVHGHAEGDRVLREVAEVLAVGREADVKARWGGEEFLVALDRATVARTVAWLDERRAEVARHVRVAGAPVTFSAGVALVDDAGVDAALIRADDALYAAKAAGRDRTVTAAGSEPAVS